MPRKRTREAQIRSVHFGVWDWERILRHLSENGIEYKLSKGVLTFQENLTDKVRVDLSLRMVKLGSDTIAVFDSLPTYRIWHSHSSYSASKVLKSHYETFQVRKPYFLNVNQRIQFIDDSKELYINFELELHTRDLYPVIDERVWYHPGYNFLITKSDKQDIKLYDPNQPGQKTYYYGVPAPESEYWFIFGERYEVNVAEGRYLIPEENIGDLVINSAYRKKVVFDPTEFEHVASGRVATTPDGTYLIQSVDGQNVVLENSYRRNCTLKSILRTTVVEDTGMEWGIANRDLCSIISRAGNDVVVQAMKIQNGTVRWVRKTTPTINFRPLKVEPYEIGDMLESRFFADLMKLNPYMNQDSGMVAVFFLKHARCPDSSDLSLLANLMYRSTSNEAREEFERMVKVLL